MLFIWWHTSSRPTFPRLKKYCASIPPIAVIEYESRRTKLSHTLHDLNVSAYITEPSSNGLYFANISTSEWSLSERPLLIVITPEHQTMNYGEKSSIIIKSRLTILTPKFESARAKLLPISVTLSNEVHFVQYAEEENPYDVLLDALSKYPDWNPNRTVVVDENMRHFVATGLTSSGARIRPHSQSIRRIRERKSPAELDILRGANEAGPWFFCSGILLLTLIFQVTLLAIREVREKMRIGMTESEGRDMMHTALRSAGLREVWALVLFGGMSPVESSYHSASNELTLENAALPHGSGTDRILTEHDLVLIDAGGSLHGYNSDVTRVIEPYEYAAIIAYKWLHRRSPSPSQNPRVQLGNSGLPFAALKKQHFRQLNLASGLQSWTKWLE
jgi:Xaa-Pro aminopeptidase